MTLDEHKVQEADDHPLPLGDRGDAGGMDLSPSTADDLDSRSRTRALASELRGAARLVESGVAVRVTMCGLTGREAVAALADAAGLAGVVAISMEHEAGDTYALVVGPVL